MRAIVAAQQDARSALGLLVGRREHDVLLHAADLRLTVRSDVLRVAVEHDRAVAEHDRADELLHREIARAQRFRGEVLEDRSMALAYWAMVHRDDLSHDTLGEVVRIVERVAERERDEVPWRRAAKILTDFVDGLDVANRSTLLRVLGRYAEQFGDAQAAAQLSEIAAGLQNCDLSPGGPSLEP